MDMGIGRRLLGIYSKACVKQPLSKWPKNGFQDQLSLNAGWKYCRMLPWSILQYFWPALSYHLSVRFLFLAIFEWPFYCKISTKISQHFRDLVLIPYVLNPILTLHTQLCNGARNLRFGLNFHLLQHFIFTFSKQSVNESLDFCNRS